MDLLSHMVVLVETCLAVCIAVFAEFDGAAYPAIKSNKFSREDHSGSTQAARHKGMPDNFSYLLLGTIAS